jgi:hypothetical protein
VISLLFAISNNCISSLLFLRSYSGGIPCLSQAISDLGLVITGPFFFPGLKFSIVINFFFDMSDFNSLKKLYKFKLYLKIEKLRKIIE